MSLPGRDEVHRYWFGDVTDWAECVARNYTRWFERGRELDDEVRTRFGELVAAATRGELSAWSEDARGALALVLCLDQFPRHIFRGEARAFASDAQALAVCTAGIERGMDRRLCAVEQSFFYLPLQHAEDPEAQERSVALMRLRAEQCEPPVQPFMRKAAGYAEAHRDIVARFGRFPHRNEALGRSSTALEIAFLEGGAARFGQ
jgi:uncharacterized protein (DUF924 family)